jgi:glycosyltransferase involved in cell wall biosynthesis
MASPSVSVVIPTYNSASLVTDAVDSVLAQTCPPAEIWVIDDGSVDDTRQRLSRYRDRISYVYQENGGVSSARNRGLLNARGDLVAFLDADDVWHPRKLECQLRVMAEHPTLGLLGTRCFDWPAPGFEELRQHEGDLVHDISWERLVVANCLTTSSIIVRRSVLERVGEFDTDLQGPEDHDLWLRITEVSRSANLGLALTGYRNVAMSLSKQAARMEVGMRRILKKLDRRNAWRHRHLLRQKAHSYVDHSCGFMYGEAGCISRAILRSARSLLSYPLPYGRDEVKTPLERPKRLIGLLFRAVKLLRPANGPDPMAGNTASAGMQPS